MFSFLGSTSPNHGPSKPVLQLHIHCTTKLSAACLFQPGVNGFVNPEFGLNEDTPAGVTDGGAGESEGHPHTGHTAPDEKRKFTSVCE